MEDDSSGSINLSKIAEYLHGHPMLRRDSQVVINTMEYLIMKQFKTKSQLTVDGIIEELYLQPLVESILNNLKSYNFIEFDGTNVSLHEDLLQSLKTDSVVKKPRTQAKPTLSPLPKPVDAEIPSSSSSITRDRIMREMAKSDMPVTKMEKDKEIDSLFDEVLGESLEVVLEDLKVMKQQDPTTNIIVPLIDLLKPLGYVDDTLNEENLMKIAAYQVLNVILFHHPISTEQLEEGIETEASISMMLSNLRADGLIDQTNDYRWTLSKSTLKKLKDFVKTKKRRVDKDPDLAFMESYIKNPAMQFKEALLHLKYIESTEPTLESYQDKPVVDVLNIINKNPGLSSENIKEMSDKTVPVAVMRMLSRLQADRVVREDASGNWFISPKLIFFMAWSMMKAELDEDRFEELFSKFGY